MKSKLRNFSAATFRLLATRHGRFAALVIVAGLVVAFAVRDQFIAWLGWSAVPLLGWLAVFFYLANSRPRLIVDWYRALTAGLLVALATTTALGIVAQPGAFYADESLGGNVGELMARWPFEWDAYGVATGHYFLSSLRVVVLALLAAAVIWPHGAAVAGSGAWTGAQYGARYGAAALMASAAWTAAAVTEWREALAARRQEKLAAAAATGEMTIVGADLVDDSYETAPEPEPSAEIDDYGEVEVPDLVEPDELAEVDDLDELDDLDGVDDLDAAPDGPAPAAPAPSVAAVGIPPFPWKLPSMSLLKSASGGGVSKSELTATGELIVEALREHAINVSVDQVRVGPTVTMYGLKPGWKGEGGEKEGTQRVRVDTILNRGKGPCAGSGVSQSPVRSAGAR